MADVVFKDMGLNAILKELEKLSDSEVSVGFIPGQGGDTIHADSKLTNAELATVHEYGSPSVNITPRPFMKQGMKAADKEVNKIVSKGIARITEKKENVEDVLDEVGKVLKDSIKNEITSGNLKPNLDGTRPLFKTGELVKNITHKVDKK